MGTLESYDALRTVCSTKGETISAVHVLFQILYGLISRRG